MPNVSAAISEPCSARSARPTGDSIRFRASHTVSSRLAPASAYQARSPLTTQPNNTSAGTAMPSGPPVKRSSVDSTIETITPSPSVAMARVWPFRRKVGRPTM